MNQYEITELEVYLRQWIAAHPDQRRWSTDEIAAELAQDADFNLIKLAGWLQTPDGQIIEHAVGQVLPYPYNYGADVLVEAVKIAARQRTRKERLDALALGGGVALVIVLILGLGAK